MGSIFSIALVSPKPRSLGLRSGPPRLRRHKLNVLTLIKWLSIDTFQKWIAIVVGWLAACLITDAIPTVGAKKKSVTLPSAGEMFVEKDGHSFSKTLFIYSRNGHWKPTREQAWLLWSVVTSGVLSQSKQVHCPKGDWLSFKIEIKFILCFAIRKSNFHCLYWDYKNFFGMEQTIVMEDCHQLGLIELNLTCICSLGRWRITDDGKVIQQHKLALQESDRYSFKNYQVQLFTNKTKWNSKNNLTKNPQSQTSNGWKWLR